MKIVFHIGLHKTATTSFQSLIFKEKNNLEKFGLYYPTYENFEGPGHHRVAHEVINNNFSLFTYSLKKAKKLLKDNSIILFSSEDFEYYLKESSLAKELVTIANKFKIYDIEWHVCTRDQFSYFESLYSELSKHNIVTNYKLMANQILKKGYYSTGNEKTKWIFIFDYHKYFELFNRTLKVKLIKYSMQEFTKDFPGKILINNICKNLEPSDKLKIDNLIYLRINKEPNSLHVNKKLSEFNVELNYVLTLFQRFFLFRIFNLNKYLAKIQFLIFVKMFASFRILKVYLIKKKIKNLFSKKFN